MEVDYELVGDGISLDKIDPINQKRLVTFVNFWLSNVGRFLNNCANRFETMLQEADQNLQRLEASMTLLEAKLSLIPGFDENPKNDKTDATNNKTVETVLNVDTSKSNAKEISIKDRTVDESVQVKTENDKVEPPTQTSSNYEIDPRYAKYFKMLKMGIPMMAVKQKMEMEGIDPSVLDGSTVTSEPTFKKEVNKDDSDFDDSESSASSFSD